MRHSLSRLRSEMFPLLDLCILLAFFLTVLIIADPLLFLSDLFCHYRLQYVALGVIGLIVYGIRRRWPLVLASVFIFFANGLPLLPYLTSPDAQDFSGDGTKFLLINVNTRNEEVEAVLKLVEEVKPDLLALLEINDRWVLGISSVGEKYSYSEVIPRSDNFGIALFSRYPIVKVSSGPLTVGQPPTIQATIDIEGRTVGVFVTHAVPPMTPRSFRLRNQQLLDLSRNVSRTDSPVILLGDLNASPWSVYFSTLLETSRLKDPRREFGILPTWPRQLPFAYIPIDHFLSSDEVDLRELATVGVPGSDHRAVTGEFVLTERKLDSSASVGSSE